MKVVQITRKSIATRDRQAQLWQQGKNRLITSDTLLLVKETLITDNNSSMPTSERNTIDRQNNDNKRNAIQLHV